MSQLIPPDSIWTYKGKVYRVNSVLEKNLSQYNDEWFPTVRYTTEPNNGLVFYRAVPEFLEMFMFIPAPPVVDE